jgi:hypothetical protein
MEPDICPPWWPDFLWWLLHHPPKPTPEEEWLPKLREPVEAILTALTIYAQAQTSFGAKQEKLREQMQHAALQQMHESVERLAEMSKEHR